MRTLGKVTALVLAAGLALPCAPALAQEHSVRQVVQRAAERVVEAGENETVELLLPDGTSVVLAPGARVLSVIEGGRIRIQVLAGLVRIAGAQGTAQQAIEIVTPHATMALAAASAFVDVGAERSRAHILSGGELTVRSGGSERVLYRPGFVVVADGSRVTLPRRMEDGAVLADLLRLSPELDLGLSTGSGRGSDDPLADGEVNLALSGNENLSEEVTTTDPNGGGNGNNDGGNGNNGGGNQNENPPPPDRSGEPSDPLTQDPTASEPDRNERPDQITGPDRTPPQGTIDPEVTTNPPVTNPQEPTNPPGPIDPTPIQVFSVDQGVNLTADFLPAESRGNAGQVVDAETTSSDNSGIQITQRSTADSSKAAAGPTTNVLFPSGEATLELDQAANAQLSAIVRDENEIRRAPFWYQSAHFGGIEEITGLEGGVPDEIGIGYSTEGDLPSGNVRLSRAPLLDGSLFSEVPLFSTTQPVRIFETRSFWRHNIDSNFGNSNLVRSDTTFIPRNADPEVGNLYYPEFSPGLPDSLDDLDDFDREALLAIPPEDLPGIWSTGVGVQSNVLSAGLAPETGNDTTFRTPEDYYVFFDMKLLGSLNWAGVRETDGDAGAPASPFEAFLDRVNNAAPDELTADEERFVGGTIVEERFLSGEGLEALNYFDSGAALVDLPGENRRYFFAAGNLNAADDIKAEKRVTVDTFHLSPGLQGPILDFVGAESTGIASLPDGMYLGSGDRAFLRGETWTQLVPDESPFTLDVQDIVQSPFYVATRFPGAADQAEVSPSTTGILVDDIETPVLVDDIKPPVGVVLHADLGFARLSPSGDSAPMQPAGDAQVSSISATIGHVAFRYTGIDGCEGGADCTSERVDALLGMRTIGSGRGVDSQGLATSSSLQSGDVVSTSAGGGNPNISTITENVADPGRLGFFTLQNAGSRFDDLQDEEAVDLNGGSERYFVKPDEDSNPAEGVDREQPFALLRLGVATRTEVLGTNPPRITGGDLPADSPNEMASVQAIGYAAGLVEAQDAERGVLLEALSAPDLRFVKDLTLDVLAGSTGVLLDQDFVAPNLSITQTATEAENLSFRAMLDGIEMGGPDGASAIIDSDLFAARSSGASAATSDAAMISGYLVVDAFREDFPEFYDTVMEVPDSAGSSGSEPTKPDPRYKHVKWGFFFGDLDTGESGGPRRHAHMNSFAAGPAFDGGALQDEVDALLRMDGSATAEVTYTGHVVGNVANGGSVYTAAGTFTDTFDFASRTGSASIVFDGNTLTGQTASPSGFSGYTGRIEGGGLTGELNGAWVGPGIERGPLKTAPAGVVGAMSLTDGSAGGYRAVGTFAGEAQ